MSRINLTILFIFFGVLMFPGCGVQKYALRKTSYVDTHKQNKDTTLLVQLPKIQPRATTKQSQTVGGVSVSCEVASISSDRMSQQSKIVTFADPNIQGFDVYEVEQRPQYLLTPDEVQFHIKIKNNQDRVLKLVDVPIVLIVDGVQTSIPSEQLVEWKAGLIVKGFEKDYLVRGPKFSSIQNARVIYIAVYDVPVVYDKAGNIVKKDNFEWTYDLTSQVVPKTDQIKYSYVTEPIHKEQCKTCGGKGNLGACPTCGGTGVETVVEKGKTNKYRCSKCDGSGVTRCTTCYGVGVLQFPKSTLPPVAEAVDWLGWRVSVETNPLGASVSYVDPNTGNYKSAGLSNTNFMWYSSPKTSAPIIVEYKGQKVKVLPFDSEGKESDKVSIDFSSGQKAKILIGRSAD